MRHVDLRPLQDDDLDAVFDMMREPEAVRIAAFTAADPDDRDAFDAWVSRNRAAPGVSQWVVTEDGGFAGIAAAFDVDGDREVTYWIARHAWGRGVATAALGLLVSREPVRPLFARVAASNLGSIRVLRHAGFTEVSRMTSYANGQGAEIEEILFTLVPTLE